MQVVSKSKASKFVNQITIDILEDKKPLMIDLSLNEADDEIRINSANSTRKLNNSNLLKPENNALRLQRRPSFTMSPRASGLATPFKRRNSLRPTGKDFFPKQPVKVKKSVTVKRRPRPTVSVADLKLDEGISDLKKPYYPDFGYENHVIFEDEERPSWLKLTRELLHFP